MGGNGPVETSRYARAAEAGALWNRWAIYWDQVERSPGSYDWSQVDRTLEADRELGFQTNAILLGTPGFHNSGLGAQSVTPRVEDKAPALAAMRGQAARRAAGPPIQPPSSLRQPVFADGTDDLTIGKAINQSNAWARFVAAAVSRYRGRVAAWEVWNEPDFSQFWSGSVSDYVRLLKVAHLAARSVDPNARVLMGGMMYWEWTNRAGVEHAWLRSFLDELLRDPRAAQYGYYFDAIPWHFYSRPTDVYDKPRAASALLKGRGIHGKQMWVNEANAPACGEPPLNVSCADPNYKGSATIDEQADFVVQSVAYALAGGLERFILFQYADDGLGESFGLTRNDGSIRPAYTALRTIVQHVHDATAAERQNVGNVERIAILTPRGRVTVLWARGPSPEVGSIDALSGSARLIEVDGSSIRLTPEGGRYQLQLRGATNNRSFANPITDYIIGGRPRIVVEESGYGPLPTQIPGRERYRLPVVPRSIL